MGAFLSKLKGKWTPRPPTLHRYRSPPSRRGRTEVHVNTLVFGAFAAGAHLDQFRIEAAEHIHQVGLSGHD